jgi:hypothetical protein
MLIIAIASKGQGTTRWAFTLFNRVARLINQPHHAFNAEHNAFREVAERIRMNMGWFSYETRMLAAPQNWYTS